ncbi:MAG: right-handed parallel beta-helix repeat-containing protein [Propionicimonas sp.]
MSPRSARSLAALAVAALVLGSGCQATPRPASPSPRPTTAADCPELATRIVDALQAYVDSFADVTAGEVRGAVSARQADFTAATTALRERGVALGCDRTTLSDLVRTELGRLSGGTPVQDAVADTFRADPLGGVDPSDPGAADLTVSTAEELVSAVARAGGGSTIRLEAGTYSLPAPLVVLRPISLIGAGDGTSAKASSTITASTGGATLVAATSGDLVLSDLAVRHRGEEVASVVVVAGGGYRFERIGVSGGAARDGAGGYGIVLRPASNPLTPTGSSRTLTDVSLTDNDGGGLVIAADEKPTISRMQVTGSSGCGLCWIERAAGTASQVTVTGTQIGFRVDNSAAPAISDARVAKVDVGVALTGSGSPTLRRGSISSAAIGIQATGSGSAAFADVSIENAREIGVRLSGTGATELSALSIGGRTKVGVATVADARSTITGTAIRTSGDVGLIWGEHATGTAGDVTIQGPKLGLQLSGQARLEASDVIADRSAAAAVLAGDTSSATLTRLTCGTAAGSAVVFDRTAQVSLVDSPTCQRVQR